MTDEAKPPKDAPAGAAKRPRKASTRAKQSGAPGTGETAATVDGGAADPAAADPAETEVLAPGDSESTEVTPDAGGETTAVQEAVDTQPTAVMPAADAEPTQVVTPGGGAPPTYTPIPRVATASGGGDSRRTLWIVLAVAAIAVVAVVLIWAFALRDTGDEFVGTWAPVSGEGGGLVIEEAEEGFDVSVYDQDVQLVGTYPAVRDGDELSFRFSEEGDLGLLEARLTYVEDRDVLQLQVAGMGEEGAMTEFVRVDALAPASPSPSPTPTVSPSPTASPTGSPTGSPSPTPSPTGTDTSENDQRVVDGIVAIQVGVLNWAAANGDVFPPAAEVSQDGGVGDYVSPWPTNPFTGEPMTSGSEPGDYTYEQLDGGAGYKLVGHLANGFTFTVP